MMRRLWTRGGVVFCCVFILAGVALAQPPNDGESVRKPKIGNRRPPGPRADRTAGMVQRLAERLKLDEAQIKQISEILERHYAAQREKMMQDRADQQEKMRVMRDDMRAARDDGDADKLSELREQLQAIADARRDQMLSMREDMQAEIVAILTPDQREQFEAMDDIWPGRRRADSNHPTALFGQVMRLELGAEQRGTLEELFRQYRKDFASQSPGDPEARRTLDKAFREDVMAALTEQQKEQLKKAKKRDGRRTRRPDRRNRGRPDEAPGSPVGEE